MSSKRPIIRSGLEMFEANLVIDIEDVLVASTLSSGRPEAFGQKSLAQECKTCQTTASVPGGSHSMIA